MAMRIKGTTILPRWNFLNEKGTPEQVRKVLSLLSPELQEEIQLGVLQNKWYPFEYFVEFVRAIDRVLGMGNRQVIREMAHYAAEQSLNTVYKVFFKVGSPEFIIKRASNIFSLYHSSGRLAITTLGPKKMRAVMENFETPVWEHCLTIQWWIEKTLMMTGCRNVRVEHTHCRTKGEEICEFIAAWD